MSTYFLAEYWVNGAAVRSIAEARHVAVHRTIAAGTVVRRRNLLPEREITEEDLAIHQIDEEFACWAGKRVRT